MMIFVTVREILICLLLIAGFAVAVQSALLLQDSRNAVQAATKAEQGIDLLRVTLQSQLAGKYGLISELTAAARESRKTIDVVQKTSLEERRKVSEFSDASIAAVRSLDSVAQRGASAVSEMQGTMQQFRTVVVSLQSNSEAANQTVNAATELLKTLNTGAQGVLERSTETVSNVNALVVAAAPIEEHALNTSRHIDNASKSFEETLGFLRDDFAPHKRSFWVHLADLATSGMFSAVFHLWPVQRVHEVGGPGR